MLYRARLSTGRVVFFDRNGWRKDRESRVGTRQIVGLNTKEAAEIDKLAADAFIGKAQGGAQ